MSSWFDRLLEELNVARRRPTLSEEGRPFEPARVASARRATSRRSRSVAALAATATEATAATAAGPASLHSRGGRPWRRYLGIGLVVVGALIVLALGGAVGLITDVWWYGALGLQDVFATRLWAQIGSSPSASWRCWSRS